MAKLQKQEFEFLIHMNIWITAVVYSILSVFSFSKSIDLTNIDLREDFTKGWAILNRLKDSSDYEWNTWKVFSLNLLPWLCLHFCGAELFRIKTISPRYWYTFITFVFFFYKFGFVAFILFVSQPFLYYLIIKMGGRKTSIWISSCVIMYLINILKRIYENPYSVSLLEIKNMNQDNLYMIMITVSWIHLRCLSYSMEVIDSNINCDIKKSSLKRNCIPLNLLNLLSYTFYLPLLFLGPVILYNDFEKSLDKPITTLKRRLYCFIHNFTRYIGWLFFTEFCLHYIYFNAHVFHIDIIRSMPDWCLYGGGLWMGLYFYLKYLVVYGISGSLAALDHIKPETPPRCIARVHRYSQMWKYFDVGLHKFLLRYIYKPFVKGINKENIIVLSVGRAFASLICFTFVFIWHGAHDFILVWTALNYLGIVLESVGTTISQSSYYVRLKILVLKTPVMNERFNALLATPVLIVSALSNFYFFAGYDVGNIYAERILNQSFSTLIVMFVCMYSSCRISQYMNSLHARKIMT